ncbi:MAG: hypothetical protein KDD45_02420 [Bdellovibrionales bacterium]|nr:hypothetical protein [Bdellovibrionales bacterium]
MSQTTNTVKFGLGADPELFVYDNKEKVFISSHNLIPGTKEEPFKTSCGAIQVDGVAAEFNINPAFTGEEFKNNVMATVKDLLSQIQENPTKIKGSPSKVKRSNYILKAVPVATFNKRYFKSLPDKAKELGCTPDFNAYTGEQNPPPETNRTMRTGAGHLHVSWTEYEDIEDKAHLKDCIDVVKQLDTAIYPMSYLWDSSSQRRELYGKMGSFRPKHFGVEWRPLSNVWVKDPDLHLWLFNATERCLTLLDNDTELWDTNILHDTIKWLRENPHGSISKKELLGYHKILVDTYGFKPLPEFYLKAA